MFVSTRTSSEKNVVVRLQLNTPDNVDVDDNLQNNSYRGSYSSLRANKCGSITRIGANSEVRQPQSIRSSLTCITPIPHRSSLSRRSSSVYDELRNPSQYRNALLNYASDHPVKKPKKTLTPTIAAILIQKIFRRYIVTRRYRIYEQNRVVTREVLYHETMNGKGNWPPYLSSGSRFFLDFVGNVTKELNYLLSCLFQPCIAISEEVNILHFLFSCFLIPPNETLHAHDLAQLVVDIMKLNLKKTDLEGYSGVFYIPPYCDDVDFSLFYNWFALLKHTRYMTRSKSAILSTMIFGYNLPEQFVPNFIYKRSALSDVAISLLKFDKCNPPLFSCPVCSESSTNVRKLVKHIIQCRKKNNPLFLVPCN